ncbi:MAG: addiction module protein [Pirellulaceae bacterium]|nr:addiction module protein [Pirellulaceae bacterium]
MTLEALIDNLSRDEQVIAMELLWKRISQGQNAVHPPEWHHDIVAERVARVKNGSTKLIDWDDAKRRLAERLP